METVSYSRIINYAFIEKNKERFNLLQEVFNSKQFPIFIYKKFFDNYLSKNNSDVLRIKYSWNRDSDQRQNLSNLFFVIDNAIYSIQPFDSKIKQINPLKNKKSFCFSADKICIKIKANKLPVFEYKFERGLYQKSNIHSWISSNLEFFFNKELDISLSYSINESSIFWYKSTVLEFDYDQIYDFLIFSKISLESRLTDDNKKDFIIPFELSEENNFIIGFFNFLDKHNKYSEDRFYLSKYAESRNIEYLFLIESDFCHEPLKSPIRFNQRQKIVNLVYNQVLSLFF